ncbi:hypothetical protein JCM3774_006302 [Rhodotorula dairenensis]
MSPPREEGYEPLQVDEGGAVPPASALRKSGWTASPSVKYLALAASALVATVVSASVAFHRGSGEALRTDAAYYRVGEKCNSLEMWYGRNNASFWVAETMESRHPELVIQPAEDAFRHCAELANAFFAVTVHYGNESHALMDQPSQPELGVYRYRSFPPPLLPNAGSTEFEVRLEFGFYPGGETGQPCDAPVCIPEDLARTGVAFSNDEIRTTSGQRARLAKAPRPAGRTATTSTCTSLNPLPAAFMATDDTYAFTDENAIPCDVVHVDTPLSTAPALRWIQVLGDSNSRYLVTRWAEMLNLTLVAEHTAEAEHQRHPTTMVYHDGTGTGIVLIFQWFFVRHDPSDVRNLAALKLTSLAAFIDSIPFETPPAWSPSLDPARVRMTDLFLSFGSHAHHLSQSGMRAGLARLDAGLRERFALARSTYLLLTNAAEPSTIPERYGPQAAMRNNLIIRNAQNAVAQEYIRANWPDTIIVDLFTVSRTTPLRLKADTVHFYPQVYSAQAELLWTALHLADSRVARGNAIESE